MAGSHGAKAAVGHLLRRGVVLLGLVYLITHLVHFLNRPAGSPIFGGRSRAFRWKVSHTEYKQHLQELLDQPGPHYVLFTSGDMEGTDVPWCPDCSITQPVVSSMLARCHGSLLEVQAGQPGEWSSQSHPLRLDPLLAVEYLPTLVHWTAAGPGRAISRALNQDAAVTELRLEVARFIKATVHQEHRRALEVATEVIESGGKGCGGC